MRWLEAFSPDPPSVSRARREAVGMLRHEGLNPETVQAAQTVIGELASNAARHARTRFTVVLTVEEEVVRVEVFDLDSRPPALMGVDADSTSGRGLHLVAGVTSQWGWQTAENEEGISGKVVWAEIRPA